MGQTINSRVGPNYGQATYFRVYKVDCPDENYQVTYIGETGKRPHMTAKEHARDKSYVGQHSIKAGYKPNQ